MFKNRALYIETVEKKKTMPPNVTITPEQHDRLIEDVINNVISDSGQEVVKGIVIVMGSYFTFKTVSTVIINLTA